MENYRDEALKAKATAEEKFAENDIVGATRFAVMAYGLFPKLDGILQLLVTLNVHLAAQQKVCGEKDLYGILGSSSSAEVQKLRKQYIEMAVQLHPNQNRAVGAEGALKLLTEAWDTLSDATKRMAYDQKIKDKQWEEKKVVQPTEDNINISNYADGFDNLANTVASEARGPMPNSSTPNTFWTSCNHCEMQFEYLSMYLNQKLVCADCHESFLAKDIGGPINGPMSAIPWPCKEQDTYPGRSNLVLRYKEAPPNVQLGDINVGPFGTQDLGYLSSSRNACLTTPTSKASWKVKREYDQTLPAVEREEAVQKEMNALKRKFSVPGNMDAGSSELLLTKKRMGLGGTIAHDENISLFAGLVKSSEMEKISEVSNDFSECRVSAQHNLFGGESSQGDIQNTCVEKKAADNKFEACSSTLGAKTDGKEEFKGL